ncbi:hypothetical protein FRC19_010922 [Serendipita sp. 401]|nr:hypothetical protein FRC19_010922 [Serendipita sp. 401]KAG8871818.1 hypothetical protein FRC20_010156 [Serendipita sp. 405]KAG9045376.1 hypothetical protein FS842_001205 [Serendipita sp. 407]
MQTSQSTEDTPLKPFFERNLHSVAAASQPLSCSFVFTSSKIGNASQSGYRGLPQSQQTAPPVSCALSSTQVTIHAYGASHALPESSIFSRRDSNSRQSLIRPIRVLPDELPLPRQQRSQSKITTAKVPPKPSMHFYLEAVKRATRLQPLLVPPSCRETFKPHTLLLNHKSSLPSPEVTSSAQTLLSSQDSLTVQSIVPNSSDQSDSDGYDREEGTHSDNNTHFNYEYTRTTPVFR